MDTPILLIVWRRPHTLRQVIDAIRPVAPTRLFVASDGPSPDRPGEIQKVAATRLVIDQEVDWPCKIERLYSDVNQGCSLGPITAISWFFQQVEEGIILEDDCVPHLDFLSYCTNLLERYRHDTRIWCISGNNFQNGQWRGDGSYYFSRYNHCWGWATWRRCWQHFDPSLQNWPEIRRSSLMNTIFEDKVERKYWGRLWNLTHSCDLKVTWWDYQWSFTCLVNGGLTALPNRNLVRNVGFGDDASHTKGIPINTNISAGLDPHQHPTFILRDVFADRYTFNTVFGGRWKRLPLSMFRLPRRAVVLIVRSLKTVFSYFR